MKTTQFLCVLALLALSLGGLAAVRSSAQDKPKERVFEMRTYTAHEGKFDAMHARFRDHTCKLFQKHGMELIAFWVPTEGDKAKTTLVYVLAYPDREAAKKSWDAFKNDPDWQKAKADSEKDGPLVAKAESVYMKATDYSPMK